MKTANSTLTSDFDEQLKPLKIKGKCIKNPATFKGRKGTTNHRRLQPALWPQTAP